MSADLVKTKRIRPEIAAGLVGAAVPLVAVGVAQVLTAAGVHDLLCPSGGLECIATDILTSFGVAVVLGWIALALLAVRPAWLVALAGAFLTLLLAGLSLRFAAIGLWHLLPLSAACFAAAAWLTTRFGDQPHE
ncbi:hypothetical protein [Herbidospora cretacea]|uniref:hypothetical protein n=1 Tax=Herbidospora cretacea TaxID=28444 RepID=UPI000B1DA8CF|nr:hypothetical protein [Herbidospora cretacea]